MTQTINSSCTLTGYINGNQVVFYDENARKVAIACKLRESTGWRGQKYVIIDD